VLSVIRPYRRNSPVDSLGECCNHAAHTGLLRDQGARIGAKACRLRCHSIFMRSKNNSRRCQYFFSLLVCGAFLSGDLSQGQQADRPTDSLPNAPKPNLAEEKGFFARWAESYRQDWSGTAASSPAPARRGLPSPLDSPPFPNADWSYGGSPTIGEPDTNSYPLMTAINEARSRTKLYGWIDPTLNFSTSAHSNAPEANDVYSNRLEAVSYTHLTLPTICSV